MPGMELIARTGRPLTTRFWGTPHRAERCAWCLAGRTVESENARHHASRQDLVVGHTPGQLDHGSLQRPEECPRDRRGRGSRRDRTVLSPRVDQVADALYRA